MSIGWAVVAARIRELLQKIGWAVVAAMIREFLLKIGWAMVAAMIRVLFTDRQKNKYNFDNLCNFSCV